MTQSSRQSEGDQEQSFVSHLLELRDRVLHMVIAVFAIFLVLFPFANDIYHMVASPLMAHLPEGTSMIATEVASPFLTPFKLSLIASVFLVMPYILHQFWSFVAPGLYRHERKMVVPLLISSVLLFYLGMAFAYFVVFPLVFAFFTGTAPEGVAVMTDISRYLDFVLTLFFAFGIAFEVPIATILMVWAGITTPDKLLEKRPYIIVGAFLVGMLLTPPDIISQTLLALPMWVLFELGVLLSRIFVRRRGDDEDQAAEPQPAPVAAQHNNPGSQAQDATQRTTPADPVSQGVDNGRFVPMSDDEMEAELDAIEAEEDEQDFIGTESTSADKPEESDSGTAAVDEVHAKLERVKALRESEDLEGARNLLYEVLEEGNAEQRRVARNILAQLDS